jgi:hypothetical protein
MGLISLIWFVLKPLGLVVGLILLFTSFGFYALFQSLCGVWFKTQNLKKRYNAEWALVTGSSSGETGVSADSWTTHRFKRLKWIKNIQAIRF